MESLLDLPSINRRLIKRFGLTAPELLERLERGEPLEPKAEKAARKLVAEMDRYEKRSEPKKLSEAALRRGRVARWILLVAVPVICIVVVLLTHTIHFHISWPSLP